MNDYNDVKSFTSPKNFKKGRLILNKYRASDLIVISVATVITLIVVLSYLTFDGKNFIFVLIALLPLGIILLLFTTPSAFYHNLFTFLEQFFIFHKNKRSYIWKGIYR